MEDTAVSIPSVLERISEIDEVAAVVLACTAERVLLDRDVVRSVSAEDSLYS